MELSIPKYLTDYFKDLEKQHGIVLKDSQKLWYSMKYKELGEDIKQEYPSTSEESFMGSSDGFWYLKDMGECRYKGRITNVPFQPQTMVYTAFDLGFADATAIWFYQHLPSGAIHLIDYYENTGEGLAHYLSHMATLPFFKRIMMHYLPHDAAAHEKGSGLSLEQQAKDLGMSVTVMNRYNPTRSTLMLEIQRARQLIARCYFDESNCARGIKCLENYRKKWNEAMNCYTSEAVHDFASHAADAFRLLAQVVETKARKPSDSSMAEERKKIRRAKSLRF